jgi:hypothetical protein
MPDQNIVLIIVGLVALIIGIICRQIDLHLTTCKITQAAQDRAQKIILMRGKPFKT